MYKKNKEALLKTLNEYKKYFDVNKSVHTLHEFGCANNYGSVWDFNSEEQLVKLLASKGYEDLLPEGYIWGGGGAVVQEVEEVVVPQEDKEDGTIKVVLEKEITPVSENTPPKVNWVMVDSLKSTADDKKVLETYARGFGIELRRNKSLSNMIVDFKVGLEDNEAKETEE